MQRSYFLACLHSFQMLPKKPKIMIHLIHPYRRAPASACVAHDIGQACFPTVFAFSCMRVPESEEVNTCQRCESAPSGVARTEVGTAALVFRTHERQFLAWASWCIQGHGGRLQHIASVRTSAGRQAREHAFAAYKTQTLKPSPRTQRSTSQTRFRVCQTQKSAFSSQLRCARTVQNQQGHHCK